MKDDRGIPIGELLVARGVLSEREVREVLEEQRRVGRPFGDLAERMFGIDPGAVERAWVDQYALFGTDIDLQAQAIDTRVLDVLSRRQAWQFRILPLYRDGSELVAATTREHLVRAVNFAWRCLGEPIYFRITPRRQLEQSLMKHYPWPAAADLSAAG